MTRDELLVKAARAMAEAYDPGYLRYRTDPSSDRQRWAEIALQAYRERFATGLDAIEDDIRRDERNRITAWLRECARRPELDITPQGVFTLKTLADELDRRPIGE